MNFKETLKNELNIEDDITEYVSDFEYVNNYLEKENIIINNLLKLQFVNHIYMLLKRMKENELSNFEQNDFDGIDADSYKKAECLLKPLFKKYGINENKTEITLVAIYFESSKGEK